MTSKLRSFKAIALLALLFVASLLVVVIPAQSFASTPSCPNLKPTIRIIDESGWSISGKTLADLGASPFKDYVTAISSHFVAKISQMAQCSMGIDSSPQVELTFVYRPLLASEQSRNKELPNLEFLPVSGSRYLDSPWAKIIINNSPKLVARGIFILNSRQFLLDQALLSGERVLPTQPLVPIDVDSFSAFIQDYINSMVLARSQTVESATLASLSKRISPEILWLFRQADPGRTSRGYPRLIARRKRSFSENLSPVYHSCLNWAANGYTKPTKELIDRFFASTQPKILYSSVLELKSLFSIESALNRLK
jgi:hypothetical protein